MDQKTKTLVGFAIKSRQVVNGFDAVTSSVSKNKIQLVFLHHSLSSDTRRKIINLAESKKIQTETITDDHDWQKAWGIERHKIFGIVKGDLGTAISRNINSGE